MTTTTTKTAVTPPPSSAVAEHFPDAVAFARELRALFGDCRLTWARNAQGDEIGRRVGGLALLASILVTVRLERERHADDRECDPWVSRIRYDRRTSPGAPAP